MAQLSSARDANAQYAASLQNLQAVLEQFQRGMMLTYSRVYILWSAGVLLFLLGSYNFWCVCLCAEKEIEQAAEVLRCQREVDRVRDELRLHQDRIRQLQVMLC